MLKVLGSFRTTLTLVGVLAGLSMVHPHAQPPAIPISPISGGQTVLAASNWTLEPQNSPTTATTQPKPSSSTPVSTAQTQSVAPTTPTVTTSAQTKQTPSNSNHQPTSQTSKKSGTIIGLSCTNAQLLGIKVDTCIAI